jgi:Zn-dependent protease
MSPEWLLGRVVSFVPFVLALAVHEWAHARVALQLGDDTAARLGRLTLNPLAHLDPLGIVLPLLGVPFGWAKPVPVEPTRFRPEVSMSTGLLLTAAAGPLSNLALAVACALPLRVADVAGAALPSAVDRLLTASIAINLALALFNLIPVPPLDGSRIVDGLLPFEWRGAWERFSKFGSLLVLAAFFAPQLLGFGGVAGWMAGLSHQLTGR